MSDEMFTLALCSNCLMAGFNADESGVSPGDPTPLGLLEPGLFLVGLDAPDDDMWFSHSPCEGCGGLSGNRLTALVEVR